MVSASFLDYSDFYRLRKERSASRLLSTVVHDMLFSPEFHSLKKWKLRSEHIKRCRDNKLLDFRGQSFRQLVCFDLRPMAENESREDFHLETSRVVAENDNSPVRKSPLVCDSSNTTKILVCRYGHFLQENGNRNSLLFQVCGHHSGFADSRR